MKRMLFAVSGILLTASVGWATTYTWTGGGDGHLFSDCRNWGLATWDKRPFETDSWDIMILKAGEAGTVLTNDFGDCEVYTLRILADSASFKLVGGKIAVLSQSQSSGDRPRSFAVECLTTAPVELACALESRPQNSAQVFNCVDGGAVTFSGPISSRAGYAVLIFGGVSSGSPDSASVFTLSGDNSGIAGGLSLYGGNFHFGSPTALGGDGDNVTLYGRQKLYFDAAGDYRCDLSLADDDQRNFFFNADANLVNGIALKKNSKKDFQIGYVNANATIGGFGSSSVPFASAAFEVADGCRLTIDGALRVSGDFSTATGASGGQTKTGVTVLRGSAADAWASYTIRYADLVCGAADVLAPGGTVGWGNFLGGVSNCAVLDLNGFDQTVDRLLEGPYAGYWSRIDDSAYLGERVRTPDGKPATLTMRATADSTLQTDFQGPVTLVWDPQGDYALTINHRTVSMTGDLVVRRGTFALSRAKDGNPTATMPNVRKCVLGETAKLLFGAEQALPVLEVNGAYPAPGRYQPMDGTDATATKVGWLASGSAVVTANTVTTWKAPVSGAWSEADKWTGGVPDGTVEAFATEPGADYAIRIADAPAAIRTLRVGNAAGTATLAVSNALTVAGTSTLTLDGGAELKVGAGGDVEVKGTVELNEGATLTAEGGVLDFDVFERAAGASTDNLKQRGGTILAANDAQLKFGGYFSTMFGTGLTRFSGSSSLVGMRNGATTVRLYTSPADGTTSDVEFLEHASIACEAMDQFVVGYHETPVSADTVATFRADTDGTLDFGAALVVGCAYGRGEFELDGGTVIAGRNGLDVGGYYLLSGRNSTNCDVTGVVRVRSGKLHVDAQYTTYPEDRVHGFILGAGWFNKQTATSSNIHRGYVELSGGSISNDQGVVILGAGCAVGRMVQTGGTFDSVGRSNVDFILGWLGGTGEYVLSNGVVRVHRTVYVGGLPMENTSYRLAEGHPAGHDAVGRLAISGGSFAAKSGVVVGADGAGTIAMGDGGRLDVTGGLVLTNGYVEAGSAALEFAPSASGFGTIAVSGAMTVAAGSKLRIDVSSLPDDFQRQRLVSCTGMKGAFADADVELTGDAELVKDLRVRQSEAGISLVKQRGLVLLVR